MNVVDYFESAKAMRAVAHYKHQLSDVVVITLANYLCEESMVHSDAIRAAKAIQKLHKTSNTSNLMRLP